MQYGTAVRLAVTQRLFFLQEQSKLPALKQALKWPVIHKLSSMVSTPAQHSINPAPEPNALPSYTVVPTPIVSKMSAMHSLLVGIFFSTKTATAAVTTGKDALHKHSQVICDKHREKVCLNGSMHRHRHQTQESQLHENDKSAWQDNPV